MNKEEVPTKIPEPQEFICDVTRAVPIKIKVLEERIAILERLRAKVE